MERSEPALVPQWLKSNGSISGGGSGNHHSVSLNLHSDDHFVSKHARNKSSLSSDCDIGRPFASDNTTSSYFRRSTSTNASSHLRSYSSFGRSHRDRDWEDIRDHRDTDKSVLREHQHYEHSDPLGSILPTRFEKEKLWRSQSMVTGKRGDLWPRKVAGDLTNSNRSNYSNVNGLFTEGSVVSYVDKTAFERDFPSLGFEERQGGLEIGGVSSPGLSTTVQALHTGNAAVIGGDGWTSALADLPMTMGSNSSTSAQENVTVTSASVAPTLTTLNMAETLAQAPSRARTLPQLSIGTQRLEELAIKQSRQLIPMTPSTPKTLVVSPSEKSKAKIVQQPLHTVNHTRGGPARSDSPKTLNEGRLCVLKPSRELNGVSSTTKDSLSPTNVSKVANSPHGTPVAAGSASFRSSGNSPKSGAEVNSGLLRRTIEKRPTSQTQSRNDFFNLLKKKSSTNSSCAVTDSCPASSPSISEKSDEIVGDNAGQSVTVQIGDASSSDSSIADLSTYSRGETTHCDACDGSEGCRSNGEKHSGYDMILDPDEEEAAFLRSLGWEENSGKDEGLTEEEISAFFKEYEKLRPSSKLLNGMWPQNGCFAVASSGLSSSDSLSES